MAKFVSLVNFTEQGVRQFKASPERAGDFMCMAEEAGAKVSEIYWTIGAYDVVITMEAPDDETAAAVMLALGSLGNVKTQTLRAFDSSEMKKIVSKAPA